MKSRNDVSDVNYLFLTYTVQWMSENDLSRWVDLVETTLKDRLDELTTRIHNKDGIIDESMHYLVSINMA